MERETALEAKRKIPINVSSCVCVDHLAEWEDYGRTKYVPNQGILGQKTYWMSWHCGRLMARMKMV